MAHIFGNVQVKAKLLIKLLFDKYFPQLIFACSNLTIGTLEHGVKLATNKDAGTTSLRWKYYTINDIILVFIVNLEYPTLFFQLWL